MRAAAPAAVAEFDESLFVIVGHAAFIVFFWEHGVNGLLFLCARDRMHVDKPKVDPEVKTRMESV